MFRRVMRPSLFRRHGDGANGGAIRKRVDAAVLMADRYSEIPVPAAFMGKRINEIVLGAKNRDSPTGEDRYSDIGTTPALTGKQISDIIQEAKSRHIIEEPSDIAQSSEIGREEYAGNDDSFALEYEKVGQLLEGEVNFLIRHHDFAKLYRMGAAAASSTPIQGPPLRFTSNAAEEAASNRRFASKNPILSAKCDVNTPEQQAKAEKQFRVLFGLP